MKLIDSVTVGSAVSSVTLGASNWDSSYDNYRVFISGLQGSAGYRLQARLLDAGNSDAELTQYYAYGAWGHSTSSSGSRLSAWSQSLFTNINFVTQDGLGTIYHSNAVIDLFNFNNSSTRPMINWHGQSFGYNNGSNRVQHTSQGGGILYDLKAISGIKFTHTSGNIVRGNFSLYGINK